MVFKNNCVCDPIVHFNNHLGGENKMLYLVLELSISVIAHAKTIFMKPASYDDRHDGRTEATLQVAPSVECHFTDGAKGIDVIRGLFFKSLVGEFIYR